MLFRRVPVWMLPAAAVVVVALVVIIHRAVAGSGGRVRVGHVEMEEVFFAYTRTPGFSDIQQRAQEVQELIEQALEARDQEKIREHYETLQMMQAEFGRGFESAVSAAAARVSVEKNLAAVVPEVVYASARVEVVDVTGAVMEAAGLAPPPLPFAEDPEDVPEE